MRFHRIVSRPFWILDIGVPLIDERFVSRVTDALEIIPGGQMSNQRFRIESRHFLFTNGERNYWNVFRRDLLISELLVERNIGIAVDSRYNSRLLSSRTELL